MPTKYDRYDADYSAFSESLSGKWPAWVGELRQNGIGHFGRLGFPTLTQGNERWKYTNVGPIANSSFEYPFRANVESANLDRLKRLVPWDDGWIRLVFVDGNFSLGLSTVKMANDVRIGNIADLVLQEGPLMEKHLGQYASVDDDGFTAINTAFLRDGAFVQIDRGTCLEAALHLVYFTTGRSDPTVSYPRTLILADANSQLTVVESYVGQSKAPYFTNAVSEIVLGEGAQVKHYRYLRESLNAFHIGTTRVQQDRDSTFSSTSFATGARLARNDLSVVLDGPGSSCFLDGLYVTSGTSHLDNHINVDHAKPNCTSDQYFKGVIDHKSRAVFSGRVLVRQDAQKSYAKQADKNLILSERARVNTKPSLEIFADDVQAFHGATAGSVAQDALFYMMSRGMTEEKARALLVHGFASEIIDRVRLNPLRNYLDDIFGRWDL